MKIFETSNAKKQVVKGARFASVGMTCICMIGLAQTVPVETFDDYPFLGRFTLRTEGKTIAIGKINKLPPFLFQRITELLLYFLRKINEIFQLKLTISKLLC